MKHTIAALVENKAGVLSRISGLFARRGFNIDSLAVGETENPAYSRITLVCTGDVYMREQVVRQLDKLHDVLQVAPYDPETAVSTEHLLIKLSVSAGNKAVVSDLINRYGGKVRDFGANFITAEITAGSDRIHDFIEAANPLGVIETCRSGTLTMSCGTDNTLRINHK
jgi:acetolactate synthase-1/3 small subunit